MWQVVSGTANLLSNRAVQAVVPTITCDRRGRRSGKCRATAAASAGRVPTGRRSTGWTDLTRGWLVLRSCLLSVTSSRATFGTLLKGSVEVFEALLRVLQQGGTEAD